MELPIALLFFCCLFGVGFADTAPKGLEWNGLKSLLPVPIDPLKLNQVNQTYCTCGIFFSGQFKRGSSEPPKGQPVLMHEQESMYPCTPIGTKQCSNKCLEVVSSILVSVRLAFYIDFNGNIFLSFLPQIAKHLPNSPVILCGSIDRDVFRERAYLFVQDCNGTWMNTNMSAGREFCCKDGAPYKCPNSLI